MKPCDSGYLVLPFLWQIGVATESRKGPRASLAAEAAAIPAKGMLFGSALWWRRTFGEVLLLNLLRRVFPSMPRTDHTCQIVHSLE